jgi:hypothetical protein
MPISEIVEQQPPSICLLCNGHHKEKECEDPRLRDFEVFCTTVYHDMESAEELDYLLTQYYSYASRFFGLVLLCFAIKYLRCDRDTDALDCIRAVVHYISDRYCCGHGADGRTIWSYEGTLNVHNLWRMSEDYTQIIRDNYKIFTDMHVHLRPNQHLWSSADTFPVRSNPFFRLYTSVVYPIGEPAQQPNIVLNVVTELRFHSEEENAELHECGICWEKKEWPHFVNYRCQHEFCKECVSGTLANKKRGESFTCALCRQPVDFITFHSEDTHDALDAFLV